jgi:hypothetical protein
MSEARGSNPFADFGQVIAGERFIGRADAMRQIEARVINGRSSLAIIGAPRIGKSCLAYHALIARRGELARRRIVVARVSLKPFTSANAFFRGLLEMCAGALAEAEFSSTALSEAILRALGVTLEWDLFYPRMLAVFEAVRVIDVHLVVVLEEFDVARTLFAGAPHYFDGIREPSQDSRYRVSFVTASRRSIRSIEEQSIAGSLLALTFLDHYLRPFERSDMEVVFDRLASADVEPSTDLRTQVGFYTGGHPLLVDQLAFHLVEAKRYAQVSDVPAAANLLGRTFVDYYMYLKGLLLEDGTYEKLLQILFGPVIDVKQEHVDELLRYGIILTDDGGGFRAFSEHFQAFLAREARVLDLWPLWRDTERGLRRAVRTVLINAYGESWFEVLERKHVRLCFDKRSKTNLFERARDAGAREQRLWESWSLLNPLELTQPRELFEIVLAEWRLFESVFGRTDSYWRSHALLLAKVRNPLAHSNDERIDPWERGMAEAYCQEILQLLRKAAL